MTAVVRNSSIDLSADVGEVTGAEGRRLDAAIISMVTTAHIACTGHAGDLDSMRAAVEACRESETRIGAHPSYPDREGFGRRRLSLQPDEVASAVVEQIALLEEVAGSPVASIKPHGQLYHDLETDDDLVESILDALMGLESKPLLVLGAGSRLSTRLANEKIRLAAEGFCDRRYEAGRLVSRNVEGALIEDPAAALAQGIALVRDGLIVGDEVLTIDSLCIHSDTPGALNVLRHVSAGLADVGISLRCVP